MHAQASVETRQKMSQTFHYLGWNSLEDASANRKDWASERMQSFELKAWLSSEREKKMSGADLSNSCLVNTLTVVIEWGITKHRLTWGALGSAAQPHMNAWWLPHDSRHLPRRRLVLSHIQAFCQRAKVFAGLLSAPLSEIAALQGTWRSPIGVTWI